MPEANQGRIQDELSKAFIAFEKEYMGRGPREASCVVVGDMILVRLKGVLTPAEQHLAKAPDGIELVKRMRSTLVEGSRELVYAVVRDVSGRNVISMHTDLSTQTGERIFLFTLEGPPRPA